MAYMALYRKWRPQTFKDLVGQEHISRTLTQAITSGKIGHAYLFAGPRGTGKTSTAKILAKALNCTEGPTPEPCGKCEMCQKITQGTAMDVYEIDAASNRGIDEIRDLRETVKFAPAEGRYKVYIIDEVHMLTSEAFNALLKTLEEPPAHVVFILATTEAHKVPPTIQSRCQRYDFHRITVADIEARLHTIVAQMGMQAEDEALALIAIQADGGLRDALSILDQCSVLAEDGITTARVRQILGLVGHDWIYRLTEALAKHESQTVLEVVAELLRDGKDLRQILVELTLHLRSLMIYQAAGTLAQLDLYAEQEEQLRAQSQLFTPAQVITAINRLHDALSELKWSPQPRITVEVALLELAQGISETPVGAAGTSVGSAADVASGASGDTVSGAVTRAGGAVAQAVSAARPVGAAQDEARLARLEAKLAEVTALLAKGVPAAATGAAATAKQTTQAKPLPPAKITTHKPQAGDIPPEQQEIWDKLQQYLQEHKQARFLSTLAHGAFAGIVDDQFRLWFDQKFWATTFKKAFAHSLEKLLPEIAGQELKVQCYDDEQPLPTAGQAAKEKRAAAKTDAQPSVDMQKVPQAERQAVDKAMQLLGGQVVAVENDGQSAPAVHAADSQTPAVAADRSQDEPAQDRQAESGEREAGTEEPAPYEAPPPPDDDDFFIEEDDGEDS